MNGYNDDLEKMENQPKPTNRFLVKIIDTLIQLVVILVGPIVIIGHSIVVSFNVMTNAIVQILKTWTRW